VSATPDGTNSDIEVSATPTLSYGGLVTRKRILVAAALITIGLLAGAGLTRVRIQRLRNMHPVQSLAVLPLADLSMNSDQNFLADGMTEELTNDLGKISALRVISRTSVMQYRGTQKPLSEIARELNVDAVVEGTVARSGNHLRITANLIQTSPEKHIWAESYNSEIGDALTVQGQIARAVAQEIQGKLTQQEQHLLAVARPVNPEAQDFYLRGLYVYRGGSTAELRARRSIIFSRRSRRIRAMHWLMSRWLMSILSGFLG